MDISLLLSIMRSYWANCFIKIDLTSPIELLVELKLKNTLKQHQHAYENIDGLKKNMKRKWKLS
jgi:hypothetical protein